MPVPEQPDNLHIALTGFGALATAIAAYISRRVKKDSASAAEKTKLRDQVLQLKLEALKNEIMREVEKISGNFKQLEITVKSQMANSDKLLLQQGEKFLAALKGIQAMHKRGDDRLQKMEELYKEVHHFCERLKPGD